MPKSPENAEISAIPATELEPSIELPNFLVAKPSIKPSAEPPASTEPPPAEPPAEPSPSQEFVQIQIEYLTNRVTELEKMMDRVPALEKAVSALLHASRPEPPPPPNPEQAILREIERFERGELTAHESEILVGQLHELAMGLQQRALKAFALLRQIRGG